MIVDAKQYSHLDHGYAATTHKSQGATVDQSFMLATPHFDRHATYVGLSRHRESAAVFYGREDFQPSWSRASAEENFRAVLSRDRSKDLAHDYLPSDQVVKEHAVEPKTMTPPAMTVAERLRQRADQVAQRLASEREQERTLRQGQAVEKLDRQYTLEQQRKQLEQEIASSASWITTGVGALVSSGNHDQQAGRMADMNEQDLEQAAEIVGAMKDLFTAPGT